MRRAITIALLALVAAAPAAAQDPVDPPVLDALGSIPDTPVVREQVVSWIDYDGVAAARPGAMQPASTQELLDALDADDPAANRWLAASMGIQSGPMELLQHLFATGAEWPAVVGFDFMDVDRAVTFGAPPDLGTALHGTFDPAAIEAAFAARDYTTTPADGGFALLCPPAGCASGSQLDLRNRNLANPFGGHLGRSEPLGVSEAMLIASPAIAMVEGSIAGASDAVASLADDPAWAATAANAAGDGRLIQATLFSSALLPLDAMQLIGPSSPDEVAATLERLAVGFEPMPVPLVIAFTDAATDTEQVARVVLTYPSLADAQAAAAVLPGRIDSAVSLTVDRSFRELLDDRGLTSLGATASETDDGLGVAVLELRAPLAGDEPDDSGRLAASSELYRLLVRSLMIRDLLWLVPALPVIE